MRDSIPSAALTGSLPDVVRRSYHHLRQTQFQMQRNLYHSIGIRSQCSKGLPRPDLPAHIWLSRYHDPLVPSRFHRDLHVTAFQRPHTKLRRRREGVPSSLLLLLLIVAVVVATAPATAMDNRSVVVRKSMVSKYVCFWIRNNMSYSMIGEFLLCNDGASTLLFLLMLLDSTTN